MLSRGVETKAALTGTDGGAELHTKTAVGLEDALVVNPGNAELDQALRLDNTLQYGQVLGVLGQARLDRLEHLSVTQHAMS